MLNPRCILNPGVLLAVALLAPRARACNPAPAFDRDSEQAVIIAEGPVALASQTEDTTTYALVVEDCWKGGLGPGGHVLFMDPHVGTQLNSTAQRYVKTGQSNLMFLVPGKEPEVYGIRGCFSAWPQNPNQPDLGDFFEFQAQEVAAWRRLLEIKYRVPLKDPVATYRSWLKSESNPVLVRYAGEHLPQPLSDGDRGLLEQTALRDLGHKYTHLAWTFVQILAQAGHEFRPEAAQAFWAQPLLHPLVINNLSPAAMQALRGKLFDSLAEHKPEERHKIAGPLLKHCPDYVRERLKQPETSLWVMLPFLQELKVNGSAFGKPDLTPEQLACDDLGIAFAEDLRANNGRQGWPSEFFCDEVMRDPKSCFAGSVNRSQPLWLPVLREPDAPGRRLAVALLRTQGYVVVRDGEGYRIAAPPPAGTPPLKLELVPPGGPLSLKPPLPPPVPVTGAAGETVYRSFGTPRPEIKLRVRETVVADRVCLSQNAVILLRVLRGSAPGPTWSQLPAGRALKPDLRETYGVFKQGESWESESGNVAFMFRKPGRYHVLVRKYYPYDGASYGLEAWSGVISATAECEVEVTE